MEFLINPVTDMLNKLINESKFYWRFNRHVEEFEYGRTHLIDALDRVQKDVETAKNAGEDIEENVNTWRRDAKSLIEEDTKTKQKCFFNLCPNCIGRYLRGKDLARKKVRVQELIESSKFTRVGRPAKGPGIKFHSSPDYIEFETRKLEKKQLLDALADRSNYLIGLQGTGGCGKSHLVKEVGNEVEYSESKLFDIVIYVVVSSSPDVRKIQLDIARHFGLTLEEGKESEYPEKLWSRLTKGEKILIIMDDVWKDLKLKEDIGIPNGKDHGGCCVLIISRYKWVCTSMDCQCLIELKTLSKEDAWTLFKQRAALSDDFSNNLKKVGQEIVEECQSLPVAIAAVASTLRGRSLEHWKLALTSLKIAQPIENTDEGLVSAFRSLQLSYNYLKSNEAKKLFLLCSLFPEDYEIPIEDLTRFGIGLGLFGEEVHSYEILRGKMISALYELIDSCLVQPSQRHVSMHDLIRDVAHWIANHEIESIMGPGRNLVNHSTIRYLYCQKMNALPNWLSACIKLEFLSVSFDRIHGSATIPESFFEHMEHLKVLHLEEQVRFSSLAEIVVKNCGNLKWVKASNCVKENADDQIGLKPHNQQVRFSSLADIIVKNCGNLKCLFSISTDSTFPELRLLFVENNLKLKQVFASEQGRANKRVQVVLPKLKCLVLKELPSLDNNVSLGILLRPVEHCIVKGCPGLTFTSTTTFRKLKNHFISPYTDNEFGTLRGSKLAELIEDEDLEDVGSRDEEMVQSNQDSENTDSTPKDVEIQVEEALESKMPSSQPQTAKATEQGIVQQCLMSESEEQLKEASIPSHQEINSIKEEGQESSESVKATHKEYSESIMENVELVPTLEKVKVQRSSIPSEKRNSEQDPLITGPHETSPTDFKGNIRVDPMSEESGLRSPTPKPLVSLQKTTLYSADETQKPTVLESPVSDLEPRKSTPGSIEEAFSPAAIEINKEGLLSRNYETITSIYNSDPGILPKDMKGSVEEAPATNPSKIRAPSNDSEPGSPVSVPLTSPLHKSSAESIEGREEEIVEKSLASEKPTPTTLAFTLRETSHDLVDGHALNEPILKNQQQQANGETKITIGIPQRIATMPSETIVGNVEEGSTLENAKIASSSIHSETRSSKQDPLVTQLHETSPKEFLVKEPTNKQTDVEQGLEENKRTHQITPREDKPSDLQHMQGPSNEKKTSLQISSTIPELKGSALTSVVTFPKRISPLISSIPKMNTAGPPSSSSGLILQPEVLQELKTELDAYLNMSLESIFESNVFDNVERIVNSLARRTTDIIQRNILEDLATRLKNFKQCIPQAINTKQSSFEFMSNYENLNMELNTKLNKGQGKVRDLELRFSETCEEEYAIEIEIQRLIARRFEILAQKNSLASQLDQSAQEVSKDYEEWKALGEELQVSTEHWLKSKEVLAHANASWRVFKESLRL